MNVVIAGVGKVGYYLAKTLIENNDHVTLIENNKVLCEKIANEFDTPIHFGDCTTIETLKKVHLEECDVFIATTGRDEENLICCQLAKRYFHVPKTIARVNNPKNAFIFEQLGVDLAVSSTTIIANLIEEEVDITGFKVLTRFDVGNATITEICVSQRFSFSGITLSDLNLPENCIVVSIIRQKDLIIPNGSSTIERGDMVVLLSPDEKRQQLYHFFNN